MNKLEKKYDFTYKNDVERDKIICLFENDIIDKENHDDKYLYYVGTYYNNKLGHSGLMEVYYLMAIDKGNERAMFSLGYYYYGKLRKYDKGAQYFLMATEKNHVKSMFYLACYYGEVKKNYDLMKKYYLMAIKHGDDAQSMVNLGYYYQTVEKEYNLMIKYYLMAIDKGKNKAMYCMSLYYRDIERNYRLAGEYYFMALENGHKRDGDTVDVLFKFYSRKKLTIDDTIDIITYKIDGINLNDKIILDHKFIFKYHKYLIGYGRIKKYHTFINLVYCD
jgi:TPR repeat protein